MFMDDDVVLLDDTFDKMNECIRKFSENKNIAGFGFNQIEKRKETFLDIIKNNNN